MISTHIQEVLGDAGLSSKEIQVYIALLSSGRTSASSLANHTGLKKPTTYVILETLAEKGLAQRVPRTRKRLYEAQSPQVLEQTLHQRLNRVHAIIPNLLALATRQDSDAKMLFFEGLEGVRQAYHHRIDELKGTEFTGFYGSAIGLDPLVETIMYQWSETNHALHIRSRTIVPDHPSLKDFRKADKQHLRTVKKVAVSEYSWDMSLEITILFVRIIMYHAKQSVILESPTVCHSFGQIFEMLWHALPQKTSGYQED